MREGGKAAVGGCSEVDFFLDSRLVAACTATGIKNNLNKYGDDDEDEMPVFCIKMRCGE